MTRHKTRARRHREAALWLLGVGVVLTLVVVLGSAVGTNLTTHPASIHLPAAQTTTSMPSPPPPPVMGHYMPPPPPPVMRHTPPPPPAPPPPPPVVVHAAPRPSPAPPPPPPAPAREPYYADCAAARAAGAAPILRGQPGYRAALDRDGDGVACEPLVRVTHSHP